MGEEMEQRGTVDPIEFCFIDLRPLYFLVGLAFTAAVLFIVSSGRTSSAPATLLPMFAVFCGLASYAYRYANKPVLVLLPTQIKVFGGAVVPGERITRAEIEKNWACIFYTGHFGEENKAQIAFRDIRRKERSRAKAALVDWLRERNVEIVRK